MLFFEACSRSRLCVAQVSYSTVCPSIRNHLANPPSIPSTTNLNLVYSPFHNSARARFSNNVAILQNYGPPNYCSVHSSLDSHVFERRILCFGVKTFRTYPGFVFEVDEYYVGVETFR